MYEIADSIDDNEHEFDFDNSLSKYDKDGISVHKTTCRYLSKLYGQKIGHIYSISYKDRTQFYISLYTEKMVRQRILLQKFY